MINASFREWKGEGEWAKKNGVGYFVIGVAHIQIWVNPFFR